MDFLLFSGDTNLLASLDGENDLLSLAAADDALGDFLLALVGEIQIGGLLIFTWNFEAAVGDFIKNLCGVVVVVVVVLCRFLTITGDLVFPYF